MSRIVYTIGSGPGPQANRPNLLMRIAAGALSALVLIASAFLGLLIFLAVLGLLAVAGTILAVRLWFFRQKVEAARKQDPTHHSQTPDYVDVEYQERDDR